MKEDIEIYNFDKFLLDEEKMASVGNMAALNYTPEEMALYLEVNTDLFLQVYNDENSDLRKKIDEGMLKAKAEIEIANLNSARTGNIAQAQRYDKIIEARRFESEKQRIIYGND